MQRETGSGTNGGGRWRAVIRLGPGRALGRALGFWLCCLACLLAGRGGATAAEKAAPAEHVPAQGIDFTETLETFDNPERGFYSPFVYGFKETGNAANLFKANLYHLRLDLSAFSGAGRPGGEDREISADALACFGKMLAQARAHGGSAIVRFAYQENFTAPKTREPGLQTILRHQEQLGAVIAAHADAVACVETGLLGLWGELHGSPHCTPENLNAIIGQWLRVLPPEITVNVRTPGHFAAFAGVKREALAPGFPAPGTPAARVGIYNDGYLGSLSDLGTFRDREQEIAWIAAQAERTLYGGEMVAWHDKGKPPLNTAAYMAREGFRTHTTYLNREWNDKALAALRQEKFSGADPLYAGKSGYLYVENHLGYRLVLRAAALSPAVAPGGVMRVQLKIENVGFGNLVNPKKVTLFLRGAGGWQAEIPTNLDPREWRSAQTAAVEFTATAPAAAPAGRCRAYLRISRDGDARQGNYQCVRFANPGIWDAAIGANFIGEVTVR